MAGEKWWLSLLLPVAGLGEKGLTAVLWTPYGEHAETAEVFLITDYADYTENFDVENERSLGRIHPLAVWRIGKQKRNYGR
jgi:hypothetical protein